MKFAKHWAGQIEDYAIDLAWSPDGALLAVAAQSGAVTLLDAGTGAVKHTLPGHVDGTNALSWMPHQRTADREQQSDSSNADLSSVLRPPSSDLLATGGQDGSVRFWDTTTGAQTAEAKPGNAWVEHLAIAPSGTPHSALHPPPLFAAAGKKLVALNPDGAITHTFPDAPKTITAVACVQRSAFSAQPLIASVCFGQVRVFDAVTFAAGKEYTYGNALLALTWSPDGRWLVAGCHDNAVHLWAPAEDLELHMSGYETKLRELSFSYDSKWLATGGGRDACVWDCSGPGPEGREPLLLPHKAPVRAVAFQNNHGLLATGAADGEFTLWGPTRASPLLVEVRMPAAATKFAWNHDDSQLAVGTEQGHVFVFKTT
jgi:WD40 repeat protein